MLIAVAGNIGSGKTTLTTLLAKHYNWDAHFEDVDENPYLNDFYNDMQRWSFNLQIYYMTSRISKIEEMFIQPPDILIYLRASVSTLVNQIQKRGRDYEESIRLDYLKCLNERYEAWISTYNQGKLIIVDVDTNNFSEKAEDLGKIIQKIDAEMHGLFEEK